MAATSLAELNEAIVTCSLCPRLVTWREMIARDKRKQFEHDTYWGKAVPSFGDPNAEILIVGLAPAAHGANRTGRMFTGDNSGLWLYRALYKAGLANQPNSAHIADGLTLKNVWITAICHCAPPQNKVLPDEIANCQPFLQQELALLAKLKVFVCLGSVSLNGLWKALQTSQELQRRFNITVMPNKPAFGHNVTIDLSPRLRVITSYHPSQQNTFTGKLTEPMLDAVLTNAQRACC